MQRNKAKNYETTDNWSKKIPTNATYSCYLVFDKCTPVVIYKRYQNMSCRLY